ncbi:hypothetical protein BK121_27820 [Paenibacillus odorifer]|uniref:recombinase family protein n=2 Tax=Paenibacillus odorifer TaxID=189426 RepID=UPI00096BF31C|nr:hypothetical protein BK121_27820 [Paenibacillus odorifer]OMC77134.1 hypothetical protein BK125_15650 [Paenibacillus odorifer]
MPTWVCLLFYAQKSYTKGKCNCEHIMSVCHLSVKQRKSCLFLLIKPQQYCLEKGWSIVGEFIEKGKSVKTDDRPEFQKMIALAKRSNHLFARCCLINLG